MADQDVAQENGQGGDGGSRRDSWFDAKLKAVVAFLSSKKRGSQDNEENGEVEDQTDMGNCCSAQKTSTELDPVKWAWEQKTLKDKLTKFDKTVTHAAIVSFSDGELRAVSPENFRPSPRGLKDIINAFNGDVDGVASNGIDLGGLCKVSTPGKLEDGILIGADGQGGGCTILKTKECLLIVVYSSDPAPTNRLAMEVAEFMAEDNNK